MEKIKYVDLNNLSTFTNKVKEKIDTKFTVEGDKDAYSVIGATGTDKGLWIRTKGAEKKPTDYGYYFKCWNGRNFTYHSIEDYKIEDGPDTPIGLACYNGAASYTVALYSPSCITPDWGTTNSEEMFLFSGHDLLIPEDYNNKTGKEETIRLATVREDLQPLWRVDPIIQNIPGNNTAAKACFRFHTPGTEAGDWHLPSLTEAEDFIYTRSFQVFCEALHRTDITPSMPFVALGCTYDGFLYTFSLANDSLDRSGLRTDMPGYVLAFGEF